MELILFIGLQASGKSTFYQQRFRDTHVRINLDMLRTRHRENLLFRACLDAKQPMVVDNTNPTRRDRRRYHEPARAAGFRVRAYYFAIDLDACKARNAGRDAGQQVPLAGLLSTRHALELPSRDEGFDAMYYVRSNADFQFDVQEWQDEVR